MARNNQTSGGIAGAAGPSYQDRVAAWLAVRVLAETDVNPGWGLPATCVFETIRAQTGQPIDDVGSDILDSTTGGRGFLYVTAKTTLNLSEAEDGDLAKVIDQCVRQFLAGVHSDLDRFIVVARRLGGVAGAIDVLSRIRRMPPLDPLAAGARTKAEREILRTLIGHATRSWRSASGTEPSASELRAMLSLIWFQELDPEEGGRDERDALDTLRRSVLQAPADDARTWKTLVVESTGLARLGAGASRGRLQSLLTADGVALKVPRRTRASVEALERFSGAELAGLRDHASIKTGTGRQHIDRDVVASVLALIEQDSLLLTGDPGSGKTGVLVAVVEELKARGADLFVISAEDITAENAPDLEAELRIEGELQSVLDSWPSDKLGVVAIDGLDALRGQRAERVLQNVIERVASSTGRWRALVTIRSYDARRSAIASTISGRTGQPIERVELGDLTVDDIESLRASAPELYDLATNRGNVLAELLRNPFNLHLAAQLVYQGTLANEDLSEVRSQLELLDLYWLRRVIGGAPRANEREAVVRHAAQDMAENRRMSVPRATVAEPDGEALEEVLSAGALVERSLRDGRDRDTLTFFHNVLFDYAVSRLLRGDDTRLARWLGTDPTVAVLIRPSLVMHFHHLWNTMPRGEFWRYAATFVSDSQVPPLARIVVGLVAAERVRSAEDLDGLRVQLGSGAGAARDHAEYLLRLIVNAITASDEPRSLLAGANAAPWLEFIGSLEPFDFAEAAAAAQLLKLALVDD